MDSCDVIIAGSGMAGLLALSRLSRERPDWTFTVLEREPWHGGRMRPSLGSEGSRSCGLQTASTDLYRYVLQSLQLTEDESLVRPMRSVGVMIGQKIQELAFEQFTTTDMAKAIAGNAATKDWPKIEELLAAEAMSEEALSALWKGDKKSPALVPLEQLAHYWGVPELSGSSIRPLQSGYRQAKQGIWTGRWDLLFDEFLSRLRSENRLRLIPRSQIMTASYEEKTWTMSTTQGTFQGQKLLVAQSPWEAFLWLPKDYWPSRLINIASKTKPVSLVSLSELSPVKGLPDLLIVTAEDTQVLHLDGQIVYQTPINYELTVQAPAVGKAVKRLKRARKKLSQLFSEIGPEGGEHLALLSVGWTHSIHPPEYKWFEKLDAAHIQKPHLGFAGDGIGAETTADLNVIRSVEEASDTLMSK
ncbi:MAG: hypothetical protein EOP10_17805 [Proteobacteria bacterium]|nr:MAG: hypothetical protein EOP10_17805 [Pseudomonadota bacterium]